ncbi:MAG: lytic transglycosylase domain-containing protein [Burkholderiaceae bacterium]
MSSRQFLKRWMTPLLLVLLGLAAFHVGRSQLAFDAAEQAITFDDESIGLSDDVSPSAPKAVQPEARRLRKPIAVSLDPQQTLLAIHISNQYRRALDLSRELVHHAYQVSREAQIDPLLVLAIISVESRFNPLAESPAGAQGLMQVLTRVHFAKFKPFGGVQTAFDPATNLKVGTAILRHYLQAYDTLPLALKAYVGAAQAEHDFGYGAKVLAAREHLEKVATGSADPIALNTPRMVPVSRSTQAPFESSGPSSEANQGDI